MPVTNITALKRFAANQNLTPKRAKVARTNYLLIERNLEQDRLIWEGLPANGQPSEAEGEMEGGRTEEIRNGYGLLSGDEEYLTCRKRSW